MIPCIPAPRARSLAAAAAATILSLAFAAQAMAAPAYVKSASGSAATATSLAVSVPSVAAGDTLIASVRAQAGQSVSDSLNGAWTLAGETSDLLNGVWFLSNSKAGADTITLHGTTSGTMRIIATEYSGVGALATHACNTGTGTSVTNLNFANVAGQLAYASLGVFNQPITATADAGATIRTQFTGSNGTEAQEDLVTEGTARSMGFTLSSAPSGGWATCELLFDASTGGDTTSPSVPSGLTASPGNAQASLSWTASTDNVAVTGYDVYRGGVKVGSSSTASYTDTGLTNGTSYSYTVDAYDAAGNHSAQSSAVSVTPTASTPATWFGTFSGPGGCGDKTLYPFMTPAVGYSTGGTVNQCVPDPGGSGQTVLQMTVTPQTCTYNCENRLDRDGPRNMTFNTGGIGSTSDWYISIPIMEPTSDSASSFPSGNGPMFDEQFGAPTSGSPSNALSACKSGSIIVWCFGGNTSGRAGGGHNMYAGTTPSNDGHWHDFIEHMVASTNPAVGEIQIWEDGNPITFSPCSGVTGCGTTTLHYATVIPGGTDGSLQWVQINNYRSPNASFTNTFYHGAPALGRTYASVAGTIANAPYGP